MWIVCITSVRHVLTVNGYGGRQTKENEKSWCFKGWETLVILLYVKSRNRNWLWMIENQCVIVCMEDEKSINLLVRDRHFTCKNKESFDN